MSEEEYDDAPAADRSGAIDADRRTPGGADRDGTDGDRPTGANSRRAVGSGDPLRPLSRRTFLASAAVAGAGGVAGCTGLLDSDDGGSGGETVLEGFEDDALSKYSGDTGQPTLSDARATQGNQALEWISETRNDGTIDTQELTVERPATMTYDIFHDTGGDAGFLFAVQDTPSGYKSGSKYVVAARQKTGSAFRIIRYRDGSSERLAEVQYDPPSEEWIEVEVNWRDDGTIDATATDADGETIATVSAQDDSYSSGGIGWRSDDNNNVKYYDNLRVQ